jgi:D-threo-aldose 1-dehydrogenase
VRELGRTGVEVTELGFGAAPLGGLFAEVSTEQAQGALAAVS